MTPDSPPAEPAAAVERTAIVLLSGGLDSTTMLSVALREGFAVHALTFRYGQRHALEIDAARRVAEYAGVTRHVVVDVDIGAMGGSALTTDIAVPRDRSDAERGIPVTYVPARNTIFLAYAVGWAEVTGALDIFIGVNAVDYSGYPDCRPEFLDAFERMANLATKAAVQNGRKLRVRAPLLHLSKRQIIQLGMKLGVDYSMTVSCYDPSDAGEACGHCDACRLRLEGFGAVGEPDPVRYKSARPW
ncbi:MAG: 7-cyano-7-deazaguanine synthase QueC [Gemmatimonadaceae bacterium]